MWLCAFHDTCVETKGQLCDISSPSTFTLLPRIELGLSDLYHSSDFMC